MEAFHFQIFSGFSKIHTVRQNNPSFERFVETYEAAGADMKKVPENEESRYSALYRQIMKKKIVCLERFLAFYVF